MSIISEERRRKRRIRWAVFRYKWLKGNCRHICRMCKYHSICDVWGENNAACGSDSALAVAPDDPYPFDCGQDPRLRDRTRMDQAAHFVVD